MPVIGQRPEIALDDIVFATDFSPASRRAEAYALQIARRYSSRLHIVTIVDLNIPIPAGDGTCVLPVQEMVEARRAQLDAMIPRFAGIHSVFHVAESFSVAQAILATATECGAALIVMGTSSKGMLKKLVLGSVAEEVIRNAKPPVLTVGPHVPPACDALVPFQRILFANDMSPQAKSALPVALAFAEDGGARLVICRVTRPSGSTDSSEEDSALEQSLQKALPAAAIDWCDPEYVVEHGDPSEALVALAQRTNSDLIVLGSRRSNFRLNYLERGVTPAVIAQARCPVLSLSA
ncbi:universal stress protein UspA-like protein [Terriglobus roseus DSM 18391]|uniref:Universal stress protein UspA-like protein n=1 Tax=Terriglobus roseus (strain DSM 18391 / NRRL B-41598 / KBS 63) TaxID=926566 RepID=I3ZHT3_TERRK|nr:universal stress protein [Terriglobus roseus]AFL88459.1 universal stress protein UspA-like protein [Terriglobus roseus DSM 18391]AFL88801.1 universal stress protein UspA-like protein [Terriglobus roseus DSM 18391]